MGEAATIPSTLSVELGWGMNQQTPDKHPGKEHLHQSLAVIVTMIVMLEMSTNCHHLLLFLKRIDLHVYHLHRLCKRGQSWTLILTRQTPLLQLFSSLITL